MDGYTPVAINQYIPSLTQIWVNKEIKFPTFEVLLFWKSN